MNTVRVGLLVALTGMLTIALSGCGSSSSTSTAPATVPRCGVTIGGTDFTVPASGGGGVVAVTTARECAWTATSTAAWLTFRGTASGQGDGSVEYVASANPDPATRRGAIDLNDQHASVTQGAADCSLTLTASSANVAQTGGSGTITVRASSSMCTWTAVSDSSWITIRSGASGTGNGTVAFDVAAAPGVARTGTIVAAGLRFSVTQAEGCSYTVAPTSISVPPSGGGVTITVTAPAACPWTAASNSPWVTVPQGATGAGPGSAQISIEPTVGPGRRGSLLVAGQSIEVAEDGGCNLVVGPLAQSFGAQGGPGSASVQTTAGCGWSVSTDVPWITLQGATTGNGSGTLNFNVAAVSGPGRTGTVTVSGSRIVVTQSAGCTFGIAPQAQDVPTAGGEVTVTVAAADGCAWTATSGASWITIAAGAGGSGNGSVKLTVAAATGASRSGAVTIAGQTFTVTQGGACSFSIAPASASTAAAGGTGSVAVTAPAGCAWTATSNAPWLSITAGASGSGNGTVNYTAASTTSGSRSGTLTIAGQTFTVNQGSGCSFSIAPASASPPAAGATGSVAVTAAAGCAWTATSNVPWITVTAGASGTGNGTVNYTVAATTGSARSGTVTIGGQTFTVNQGTGCTFSLSAPSANVAASGGTGSVGVTAAAGCGWTATSNAPSWLTVTAGASGTGNGTVSYTAAANTGAVRAGTLTIGGQTFTVNQTAGCSFNVSPTSLTPNALGGTNPITVTAPAGCAWTATSGVNWITVTSGASGSGNGTVQARIDLNIGGTRNGSLTVAGQAVNVTQAATLCTWTINPSQRDANGNGGNNTFNVVAGSGCPWTATSNASWITITSGASGSGNGTVSYSVARNDTKDERAGTISVAGRTFTVNQKK